MPSQLSGGSAPGSQQPLAHYASVAHVARVYDYFLGGKDYFAVDREAAEQAMRINPDIVSTARANRAFLVRATSYLTREAGIRQFRDVGTGMPSRTWPGRFRVRRDLPVRRGHGARADQEVPQRQGG